MATYQVKSGDTLSAIAQKYGVDYKTISGYKSGNPNLIYVGETLNIPDKQAPAQAPQQPAPAAPVYQPQQQQAPQPAQAPSAPSGGSNEYTADQLKAMGLSTDLWNGQEIDYNGTKYKVTDTGRGTRVLTAVGGGSSGGSSLFTSNKPTIDVNKLYEDATNTQAIKDLNAGLAAYDADIAAKKQALADQEALINDNPFYSEATRVGKVSKLQEKANKDINNIIEQRNSKATELANAKAEAQVKVNIALKQYDIASNEYQQNLQKLNLLMSSGAITTASPTDLADIAVATGISPSMLQGVINKAKLDEVKPQVITNEDDNGNVTVSVIDLMTGKTINQSSLGKIAKKSTTGSGGLTATQQRDVLGAAGSILSDIDANYQTVNGSLKKLYKPGNGDKRLSLQEYQKAVDELMNKTGLSLAQADDYLTKQMQSQGYSKWQW